MSDPTRSRWTTPQTVFDLHGYFRVRTHFQDNFFLNRVLDDPQMNPDNPDRGTTALPFSLFRPRDDGVRACDTNGDGVFEDPLQPERETPSARCGCASSRPST